MEHWPVQNDTGVTISESSAGTTRNLSACRFLYSSFEILEMLPPRVAAMTVAVALVSIHLFTQIASETVVRSSMLAAPSTPLLRADAAGTGPLFFHRLRGGGRGGGPKHSKYSSESETDSSSESDESDDVSSESYDDDNEDLSSSSEEEPRAKKSRSESRRGVTKPNFNKPSSTSRGKADSRKFHKDSVSESDDEILSSASASQEAISESSSSAESDDSDESEVSAEAMESSSNEDSFHDFANSERAQRLLSLKGAENRELVGETRDIAEAPSGKLLSMPCPGHAETVLEGLQRLRQDKSTCDTIFVASDTRTEFGAHRSVIGAVSPELKSLIDRSQSNKVVLADVDAHSLELLLNFIYTGKASVLEDNLPILLGLCEKFGVRGLRDSCVEHLLRELNVENAIRYRALGHTIHCVELYEAAHHLIMDEFVSVSATPSFLELDGSVLAELVGSDDLAVDSEKDVFDAIIRWVEHDESNRKSVLLTLLGKVRLGLLDLDVLAKKVAAYPLVQKHVAQDPIFQAMLNSAITYVGSQGESKSHLEGPQTRLRTGSRGRYMICLGGREGGSSEAVNKVWMLDRVHYDWYELLPMPSARKQLAAAELGGKVYVCGGWDGRQYLRSVEVYAPGARAWTKSSLMQVARGSFGLASMDGQIWAAGGYDGQRHLASVERHNASTNSWVAAAPLITARSGLRLAVLPSAASSTLYAVGGFDGTSVLPTVERYDAVSESWKQCAPMSVARRDFALACVDGFLYAAGGFDGAADLAAVERYDPVRNEWKAMANMTKARSGFGMVCLNGKLHAVGGYDGKSYVASAEVFDHRSNTWCASVEAALPVRMAHFAVTLL